MANPTKSGTWFSRLVKSPHSQPSDDTLSDAKSRRREQVRRAQRNHRDRKASYVKALELEVAKLRAKDLAQEEQIRSFQYVIDQLRNLLNQHNIDVPNYIANVKILSPQATIEVLNQPGKGQTLRARMPPGETTRYPISSQLDQHTPGKDGYGTSDILSATSSSTVYQSSSPNIQTAHPYGLDKSQVGIDFVLALEQPCLPHHGGASTAGPSAGHSMMMLTPIMARSPPTTSTSLPVGTKWNVPAIELEKLLAFSERLILEEEITPVQAWQRIRFHDKFNLLTPTALASLQTALLLEVQCHGFGAVLDEVYFEQLLTRTFTDLEHNIV